jgi:hypothetical protein
LDFKWVPAVFVASPAASQDGEALVAEIWSKRNFLSVPWDCIGIRDFHRWDTRNRWGGSLGQQQCRTTIINGNHYAV